MKNFHAVYHNHFIQFQVFINRDFHYFFLNYDKFKDKSIDIDEVKSQK